MPYKGFAMPENHWPLHKKNKKQQQTKPPNTANVCSGCEWQYGKSEKRKYQLLNITQQAPTKANI